MKDTKADCQKEIDALKEEILLLEKELVRSQFRLDETQSITNTGSWSWDLTTGRIEWSDMMYRLMGYEPQSIEPSYDVVLSHVFHEDREAYEKNLGLAIDKREDYYLENRMTKTDKSIVKVISRGKCYTNSENELIAMRGTVQNINDFSNLKESVKRLEAYSNILSHDIKSPLRTISSFMGLIKLKISDQVDEESLEYLNLVETAAKEISAIVDDILSIAFIKSERIKKSSFSVDSLFKSIIRDSTDELTVLKGQIVVNSLPDMMEADRVKLRRVFQNLINNAIKYSDPNRPPYIEISCDVENEKYHFSISDNGIGISPENTKMIFDPYFRLHSKEVEGTGIGLAVCKTVVELHGGQIWLEQNEPHGSVFHVVIPSNN